MRSVQMGDLRKQWWLIPALAVVWGVPRWAGMLNRPVKVCDLPRNPLAVQNGRLVFPSSNPDGSSTLIVKPATGGRERRITLSPGHTLTGAQVTESHLIYLSNDDTNAANRPVVLRTPGSAPVSTSRKYELHRVPWNGDSPHVQKFEGEPGALLTPDGCYWWGPRAQGVRPLHFLPLLGGEAQAIGGGDGMLFRSGVGGEATVLLSAARGGTRQVSMQTRGPAPRLQVLDGISGAPPQVTVGARRYWVERLVPSRPGGEPRPDRIMTAKVDGSDRKVLLEAKDRTVEFGQLLAHGEDLYVALAEPLQGRLNDGKSIRVISLCRIRPEDAAVEPRRLCTIPGQGGTCYLDGHDAYFAVQESRENWWDWSSTGLMPRRVTAWYHFRLPAG